MEFAELDFATELAGRPVDPPPSLLDLDWHTPHAEALRLYDIAAGIKGWTRPSVVRRLDLCRQADELIALATAIKQAHIHHTGVIP